MENIQPYSDIPADILEAYDLLVQQQIVEISKPLHCKIVNEITYWCFDCDVEVPCPNLELLPPKVRLRVRITEVFPHEPIAVYALSKEVRGFPHQDAESHKLCLHEEHQAPLDRRRILIYVKWAIEWLADAANGELLNDGDPYELPDFSRKLLKTSLPTTKPLIFDESPKTYEHWLPYIGEYGIVELAFGNGIPAIFAYKYRDVHGNVVRESDVTLTSIETSNRISGNWILLEDIRYERHRPPQTYVELEKLCSKAGLDFYSILKQAWNSNNSSRIGILLIGFPIPDSVGQPASEIHWQCLLFRNFEGYKRDTIKRAAKRVSRKPVKIWQHLIQNSGFSPTEQLPWGVVENIARNRLYARGTYSTKVKATPTALFGCGALGCLIAESLARGGTYKLQLYDPDKIKFGNLCRHTLDGSSVGFNKAETLASRLSRSCPSSNVVGWPIGIPLDTNTIDKVHPALNEIELFIDCTTSESAFDWLNLYTIELGKKLASVFFNFHAEILTVCMSSKTVSCKDVFLDLVTSIKKNLTPVDPDVYFKAPLKSEQIIEGAGCWHPSFPALHSHVQILAACAVELITDSIDRNRNLGFAAIVRRNAFKQDGFTFGPIVELVWKQKYR